MKNKQSNSLKYKIVNNKYSKQTLLKEVKIYLSESQIDHIIKCIYRYDDFNFDEIPNIYSMGLDKNVINGLINEKEKLNELNKLLQN